MGTIVGNYDSGGSQLSGFIYHNGQWASLKFPNSVNTSLVGISNAGVIIGNALMPDDTQTAFVYENAAFKVIAVPNATGNSTTVFDISPNLGLIVGTYSSGGFIAKCH